MKRLPRTLSPAEIRVLGSLLEKEQATPDYYPMTVNAVTNACNQKTNRDPVMNLSTTEVQSTLDLLFNEDVLAWRSRSGRATKWKHNVDRRWQLTGPTKAVLTLLLLRGPQTIGELRSRSERLYPFDDLLQVEQALSELADGEEPLVREMSRAPGQKENRWTHLVVDAAAGRDGEPAPAAAADSPRLDRLTSLEERVARLEEELARLLGANRGAAQ